MGTDPQVLGSGVIPLGIIILIAVIYVIYKTVSSKNAEPVAQKPVPTQEPKADSGELSAVIAAALAVYMGSHIEGIRIHSITPRA